ncbi:MAG: hypothetical protein ACMUIP_00725 [bacterium]
MEPFTYYSIQAYLLYLANQQRKLRSGSATEATYTDYEFIRIVIVPRNPKGSDRYMGTCDSISPYLAWLKTVRKDWINANRRIQEQYPLNCRYGIVPNAIIRNSLADIYRLDKELGKTKSRKFIRLVET